MMTNFCCVALISALLAASVVAQTERPRKQPIAHAHPIVARDPQTGELGLDLMRAGRGAPDALKSLLSGDAQASARQVAMIDAKGNVAAHTGEHCIEAAGHRTGANFSAQAGGGDIRGRQSANKKCRVVSAER